LISSLFTCAYIVAENPAPVNRKYKIIPLGKNAAAVWLLRLLQNQVDMVIFVYYNQFNKSGFADEIFELSLFFKAFRTSYSEMISIFPCFCPYGQFTRESFF